ncbi:hypothetical protein [Psychrobacter sp. AOP7-A1-24]|uniref:hypothetical protein n=1 Tax=Psychrobacter sp. AOP7-A1-24 TaxID=3457646 RepID=UPI00402B1458
MKITSLALATGFKYDYNWLEVDVLDDVGRPLHTEVSRQQLVFISLAYLSYQGRDRPLFGGEHDARRIAIKKKYHEWG